MPEKMTPSDDRAAAAALEDLTVHLLQREAVTPKKGEHWDAVDGTNRTCRVMCDPVEGYVMARYKGAGPWLLHVNDWYKKFKRHAHRKESMKIRKSSKFKAASVLFWRQLHRGQSRTQYAWGPRTPQDSQRMAELILSLLPTAA